MEKLIKFMILAVLVSSQYSCIDSKFSYEPDSPIRVNTGVASNVKVSSATVSGSVNNLVASNKDVEIGVYYSNVNSIPEYTGTFVSSGRTDNGSFSVTLTGLTPETKYYFRACVKVGNDVYYGDVESFTTKEDVPEIVVTTGGVSNITSSSATISGSVENVVANFGTSTVSIGIVYGTNTAPVVNTGTFVSSGRTTDGAFSISLIGLAAETTYYYRSCVYVFGGEVYYGNVLSFETKEQTGTDPVTGSFTVDGVTFSMLSVEGGTFTMGASEQDSDAYEDEKPAHQVTLSDFYIGKYEVTQGLWEAVMSYSGVCADGSSMSAYASDVWLGSNPSTSYGLGANYPAYYVSHDDIVNIFIPRLNQITGRTFRLPTEAEWEYAARGGNKSNGYKYSGSNTIDDVAWYTSNSSSKTHEVGTKAPNELGIYDMSGNVWEWCSDWYGSYSSSSQTNPTGPSTGSYRVLRGGSWDSIARYCRVSYRPGITPSYRYFSYGFRLVLVP